MNKEQVLLNVSYCDNSGRFWQNSYIKNKVVCVIDNDIHKTVKEILKEIDGMELSYNGKPQANVYIDNEDGNAKAVGYIYRGRNEIYNDKKAEYQKAFFDIWVDIKSVSDYPITIID